MEVTVHSAAFYSPGSHPNPSQASRDESQGKPGPGPGRDWENLPDPAHLGSFHRNRGDRALKTLKHLKLQ